MFVFNRLFGDEDEDDLLGNEVVETHNSEPEAETNEEFQDFLVVSEGYLSRLNHKDQAWEEYEQLNPVKFGLSQGETEFSTDITILKRDNSVLLKIPLDDDAQMQFDKDGNSLNFIVCQGDSVEALQFTFTQTDEEEFVRSTISMRLVEASHGCSFVELVKNKFYLQGDENYLAEALEQGDMDIDHEEDEFIEQNNTVDFNSERFEFDNTDPLAQTDLTSVLSQPVVNSDVNQHMEGSKRWNRLYVTRHNEDGADLGLFKHDGGNPKFLGRVPIRDQEGNNYQPFKMMPHRQDQQMLFLDHSDPNAINMMDMERGMIVESWKGDYSFTDIAPQAKYAQTTDNQIIKAIASNGNFTIDPRTAEKIVERNVYKTNPGFNAIATTSEGYWAIAAEDNTIRLGNNTKRAKTNLPGHGDAFKSVDVTSDGNWVVATCKKYLLLFNVTHKTKGGTGFEKGMAKKIKPVPYKLTLRKSDMVKHGISSLDFTAAKFNMGENRDEKYIVTSTGRFIIRWNFSRAKQGFLKDYSIKEKSGLIKTGAFRWNRPEELLVAEEQNISTEYTNTGSN